MPSLVIPTLSESAIVSGGQAIKSFDDRGRHTTAEQIKNLIYVKVPKGSGESTVTLDFNQDVELLSLNFSPFPEPTNLSDSSFFFNYENLYLPQGEALTLVYPSPATTEFYGRLFLRRVSLNLIAYF